jgi:hypothetical protein
MGKGKTELVGESIRTIGHEKDRFVGGDTKEEPNFEVWEAKLFIKEERISTDTENRQIENNKRDVWRMKCRKMYEMVYNQMTVLPEYLRNIGGKKEVKVHK